jgi:hypothetical protein
MFVHVLLYDAILQFRRFSWEGECENLLGINGEALNFCRRGINLRDMQGRAWSFSWGREKPKI